MVKQELVSDPVQLVGGHAGDQMCLPTSTMACAAIRPAMRIFSMVSGVWTSEPVNLPGAGLPPYSGRSIEAGTGMVGLTAPGQGPDGCC